MEITEMKDSFLLFYNFLKDTTLPLFGIDFRLIDYFYISLAFWLLGTIIWFYRGENGGTN